MSSSFIKSKGGTAWIIVTSILLVLAIVVNVLALTMLKDMANLVFGAPRPIYADDSTSMYVPVTTSKADAFDNAAAVNIKVCEEGFVLLRNEGSVLPLKSGTTKLNVFGWASTKPYLGGTGSSESGSEDVVDLLGGLRNAGFEINEKFRKTAGFAPVDRLLPD